MTWGWVLAVLGVSGAVYTVGCGKVRKGHG